jgi:uncharacterized protein YndB with AHSA1/START domain
MQQIAERAYFVIADISGYTSYLVGSELEHAHDILADLVETVVKALRPVLRLAKLEGDAAFAYALDDKIDGSMLLDTIEGCYFAFRRRLASIRQATTCECAACATIPRLNLKFFAHHGECVRHRIAGLEELSGTDVILVHRLLKNRVAETFGVNAYALFTTACMIAMGLDPETLAIRPHEETYEHIGLVRGFVEDLETRWGHEQDHRRVFVTPENAEFEAEALLPAPPPIVWHYLTDPAKRVRFQPGTDRIDQHTVGGRRGVGTMNHCVHGHGTTLEEIRDWRPFEYFTVAATVPGFGPMTYMFHLTPEGQGTRFRFRLQKIRAKKQRDAWPAVAPAFQEGGKHLVQGLTALVEQEAAARESDATPH